MELYRISAETHLGHRVPFWLITLVVYVWPFTIVRNKWLNNPTLLQVARNIFFHTPHPPSTMWIRVWLGRWRNADPRQHVALWFDLLCISLPFRIIKKPTLSYVKSDWCSTCVARLNGKPSICTPLSSCWLCNPGWTVRIQIFKCVFHSCIFSGCVSKWPF